MNGTRLHRARLGVILGLLLSVLAAPTVAHAAVWASEYPLGVVKTQPAVVAVDLVGVAVDARTASMNVGGRSFKASVSQGAALGHWVSNETLAGGIYRATWTWVAENGGTRATIYCYPGALRDGQYAVSVSVNDTGGVPLSHSWNFSLASGPTFGSPAPGRGTTVKTPTPAIMVPVSDPDGIVSASATVGGVPAQATVSGGVVTVSGFTISSDGAVDVSVRAVDGAGSASTLSWTFTVAYFANQGCRAPECHGTAFDADNAMGPNCVSCHPGASHASAHDASPAPQVISISGVSFGSHQCSECHSTNLITTHGNVCGTCHPTPKDTVAGVWAKGCVQGGCHTVASSAPMHASIDAAHVFPSDRSACLAAGCHDASAITPFTGKSVAELHSNASTTTAGVPLASCQICHAVGRTPTTDCTSAGCHPERANPHGYDAATHTGNPTAASFDISGTTYPAIACSACHSLELGVEHTKATSAGNTSCVECHGGLVSQLPRPWNRSTCAQGNCHAGSSADPMHGAISDAHARLTSAADNACFGSGCHADANLAAIHVGASTVVGGHTVTSCLVCHAAGVPSTKDCVTCHPDKTSSHYSVSQHTADNPGEAMTILGVDVDTHACSECHGSELGQLHGYNCATCHPTPAASVKPWNKLCATGGCHASGANAEHAQIDSAHVTGSHSCTDDSGCHDGAGNVAAIHGRHGCADCHSPNSTPTSDCESCHDLNNPHPNLDSIHEATGIEDRVAMSFFSGSIVHDEPDVDVKTECTMCHNSNLIVQHKYMSCTICHSGENPVASLSGDWQKGCQQGDCHQDIHDRAASGHDEAVRNDTCGDCHDSEGDGVWPDSSRDWCGRCHGRPRDEDPPTSRSDAVSSYSGSARIRIDASDSDGWIRSIFYQLDNGTIVEGELMNDNVGSYITLTVDQPGDHTLKFWALDGPYHPEQPNDVSFSIN